MPIWPSARPIDTGRRARKARDAPARARAPRPIGPLGIAVAALERGGTYSRGRSPTGRRTALGPQSSVEHLIPKARYFLRAAAAGVATSIRGNEGGCGAARCMWGRLDQPARPSRIEGGYPGSPSTDAPPFNRMLRRARHAQGRASQSRPKVSGRSSRVRLSPEPDRPACA